MLGIAFKTFKMSHSFQYGSFVRWKPGMKNRKHPAYGEPAIVMEMLPTAILDKKSEGDSTSALFREPLDLVLGVFTTHDGEFLLFHYDSRRFEPLPG